LINSDDSSAVRPVPLEAYIDGFPSRGGFCERMAIRNKPAFMAIKTHSPDKPVLIFVSSRRQTRLTAQDLVNYVGMEENPKRFLRIDEDLLEGKLDIVRDESLRQALSFGIGLHHAGLTESDRKLVEELFVTNKIQVLVATSTLAWGVNFPAHLVIVKATEYFDAKTNAYKDMDLTDVLQMMGTSGIIKFSPKVVLVVRVSTPAVLPGSLLPIQKSRFTSISYTLVCLLKVLCTKFWMTIFALRSLLKQSNQSNRSWTISRGLSSIVDCIEIHLTMDWKTVLRLR